MVVPLLYLVALKPRLYRPVFPCYVDDDNPAKLTFYLAADIEGYIAPASEALADWPRKA